MSNTTRPLEVLRAGRAAEGALGPDMTTWEPERT